MFEYKFVRIQLSVWTGKPKEDYQSIIYEHGRKGYRLVQVFAPAISGYGKVRYYELIFEKPR
jgi:hypothetical protein